MVTPPTQHTATKTLVTIGLVLFLPALVILLLCAAVIYAGDYPSASEGALTISLLAFPFFLLGITLLVAGSITERLLHKVWPSSGAWTVRAAGIGALALGILLLASALATWNFGRGDLDMSAIAGRVASVGLAFALVGGSLLAAGQFVVTRVDKPAFQAADAALAVVLLVVSFYAATPDITPGATGFAPSGFGEATTSEDPAGPLQTESMTWTMTGGFRVPVVGGAALPGSDSCALFEPASGARFLLVEARWSGGPADIVLRIDAGSECGGSEEDALAREVVVSPGRLVVPLHAPGMVGVSIYPGSEPAHGGTQIEVALSAFTAAPDEGYTAFEGDA